ncbi:nicotinamide/nicotinic acid mononucleotide adenylyltransferase 1-like [Rhopilema esculentum]|uniref:nicotinamide/nicotinic acid mononucleotide adenylyltransferase 1-like n=1 Tax=Rhopilema esculentum TaxID=499914 RepID=UPI0031DF9F14
MTNSSQQVKMAAKTKVILFSCGSFNPITHMHLRLFELARDALNKTGIFEVIAGIISPVNDAYNKEGLIHSRHRIEMVRSATQGSDWLRVDDWEAKQSEWQRTRLVLDNAKEKLSKGEPPYTNLRLNGCSAKIKLLCGADMLESFSVPDLWSTDDMETIAGDYGMVVITREGSNPERFVNATELLRRRKDSIHIVTEWIYNEISATKIRQALRNGDSVRYLIPDPVIEYINKNKLYKS